jgi:xylitol oxidase
MTNADAQNWAGNLRYSAVRTHYPETVEEVREIVRRAEKVKALGTRHSFNEIADCTEDLLSTSRLNRVIGIDRDKSTVTVEGGVRYGELAEKLHDAGYALRNMASLPHISVAGACATATHGSGDGNGNLATAVLGMEVVKADGTVVEVSRERDGKRFYGMVVSLGGLGIVTKLTLEMVPSFQVRQDVYENMSWETLEKHFDAIFGSAYSISLFTDWQGESVNQVWRKERLGEGNSGEIPTEFFGAKLARSERHPIAELSAEPCTTQRGVPGAWHERLPHFRMEFTPSCGDELQSEYFVPRGGAVAAYAAVRKLREKIGPLLLITELRTIAADHLWMSPCYERPCASIHFTWKANWPGVREVLPLIEESLLPLGAVPHWGKIFTLSAAQVQSGYSRLEDFRRLLLEFDPHEKFRNGFLDRNVWATEGRQTFRK